MQIRTTLPLILALLTLTQSGAAAPTPEEEALRAALAGRTGQAVNLLESRASDDPLLKWVAGRVALKAGDLATAQRLFGKGDRGNLWGRVDLFLAQGNAAEAARISLAEMDRALQGEHREAISVMLVSWAKERAQKDAPVAARMLEAVLSLEPSPATRRSAEDALFLIQGAHPAETATQAARLRVSNDADDLPARGVVGASLGARDPARAWGWLEPVASRADKPVALLAMDALLTLPVPTSQQVSLLTQMGQRFPGDPEVSRRRLTFALRVVKNDPVSGSAALEPLMEDPTVGGQALEAWARASSDPQERRGRWKKVAQKEGASARGDLARNEARKALMETVSRWPEGKARAEAARQALKEEDARSDLLLLYWALPEDSTREKGLWELLTRFPGNQPWCSELAHLLVTAGASTDSAEKFATGCSSPLTPESEALIHHARGTEFLSLLPVEGGVDVLVAGAANLQISQHRVDGEMLFRASDGHPLETPLDAFLIEPDVVWDVAISRDVVKHTRLSPRQGGSLSALSVRAGETRATALVVSHPLEVDMLRQGGAVAVGVRQGSSPAGDTSLLILSDSGKAVTSRTRSDGIAVLNDLPGNLRILARRGEAIGFGVMEDSPGSPHSKEVFTLVPHDRALPADGARREVQVFGASPLGGVEGSVRLRSTTCDGQELDSVEAILDGGSARATLWMQGGCSVEAWRGKEKVASAILPLAPSSLPDGVSLVFDPPVPVVGSSFTVSLHTSLPVPVEGRAAVLTVITPWSEQRLTPLLRGEPVAVTTSLAPAFPGDLLTVRAEVAGRPAVQTLVQVAPLSAPSRPQPPPLAQINKAIPTARVQGAWIRASHNATAALRWFPPDTPPALDLPGTWLLSSYTGGMLSEGSPVEVVEPSGPLNDSGLWSGQKPTLTAILADGIVRANYLRPGDSLNATASPGMDLAWVRLSALPSLSIPLREAPPLPLLVTGTLQRGASAALQLGEGLSAGTRLWAFLRDGSDGGVPPYPVELFHRPSGLPGLVATEWVANEVEGEEIAAALLKEEERMKEQRQAVRVDFDEVSPMEMAAAPGLGTVGYGRGGGGAGMGRLGAKKSVSATGPSLGIASPSWDPKVLSLALGVSPGPWAVTAPPHLSGARVEAFALTPDGRWLSTSLLLPVGGPPPLAAPPPVPFSPSSVWDGTLASLHPLALSLPEDASRHALTALVLAGHVPSLPPLRILTQGNQGAGPGTAIASHLGYGQAPDASSALRQLEGLPDQRRADRVLATLTASSGNKERALAAARRLLRDQEMEPWVRARVSLAIWAAGETAEALAAATGDDPLVAASRAVLTGRSESRFLPLFWAIARNEAAYPLDRALCLHALTLASGASVSPTSPEAPTTLLSLGVSPPRAGWKGEVFSRSSASATRYSGGEVLQNAKEIPLDRLFSVRATVGPSPLPTRVHCPEGTGATSTDPWQSLPPAWSSRHVECVMTSLTVGDAELELTWHTPEGATIGKATVKISITPARSSQPGDSMSPDERFGLGKALAQDGLPEGMDILAGLLRTDWLAPSYVADASAALLDGARLGKDPKSLIAAFEAYRERAQDASLDLPTAAAVAHAYAQVGEPRRTIAATRVVLDARFQEELAAVQVLQNGGMALTALRLLQELTSRYPEVPTVIQARYLAPSMLLDRANSEGDRFGYTRSSLRHTAAGEFARFLLLHGETDGAPGAAVLLVDALRMLRDPAREQSLAGPLASRYRASEVAWRLSVADAKARFARGRFAEALEVLQKVDARGEAAPEVALELGRVYEAIGKRELALSWYHKAEELPEAGARIQWLERMTIITPPFQVLRSRDPALLSAWLRPGTEVGVTAYRIALESLLLRDGGALHPDAVRVDGLRPESTLTTRVGPSGDLPLPMLGEGAYLLTLGVGGQTLRSVVVRSDAEMSVQAGPSGDTLIQLQDGSGRPIAGAELWFFDQEGASGTDRTDITGAAHLDAGGGGIGVLARKGTRYAWWSPSGAGSMADDWQQQANQYKREADAPPAAANALLKDNANAYESLFHQASKARVQADAL